MTQSIDAIFAKYIADYINTEIERLNPITPDTICEALGAFESVNEPYIVTITRKGE